MILTAMGDVVCYKMIFGAMLRYMIFIGKYGNLHFISLFFPDTQKYKK